MARKKKTAVKEDTTVKGNQYIGYQGNISVSIVKNNRVLSKKTYHNSGMPKLFEFIVKCLGGARAEALRPVKLKLFKYSYSDQTTPINFKWRSAWASPNPPEVISSYIQYNATPVISSTVETNNEEEAAYNVTFHFTVPAAFIAEDRIDIIGLYPNGAEDDVADVSAYYLFTKEDETNPGTIIWDPQMLSDVAGDFNLFIDWTLSISNKITTAE